MIKTYIKYFFIFKVRKKINKMHDGTIQRTHLMEKMHDGNSLTDPLRGKKEEAGWHRTAVSSSLHLFSF